MDIKNFDDSIDTFRLWSVTQTKVDTSKWDTEKQ